ncbi:PRC-barrel domain containing protein [Marinobacter sp. Arc7-DN-1]|uniref:PRC-barrel domain containing protein n=1 Tax=Marinobacter sp. Arc7-DN-1 TaxID=2304594 RepID=UPI000E438806|nr:PRC-barrel domain containing protein [Marinobacter sp. Arc7-DN-1]AXS81674.1 PRC-barrel domain containing protein [Marinobacter sp. Arc7-DN-1]
MKRLHTFAFYVLVTPTIALGSGVVLAAQPTTGSEVSQGQQGYKQDQDATKSTTANLQADKKMNDQAGMQSRSYMDAAPANGMHASKLIGAEVKTTGEENVAISWDKVMKSGTADKQELRIDESRDALLSAPEYKKQK